MIDIENIVIDTVEKAVKEEFSTADITSELVLAPSNFPTVYISETDNFTYTKSQDANLQENHANLMYTIEIYTNTVSGRKTQAKVIRDVVDKAMQEMKFTRLMCGGNDENGYYRLIMRYRGIVSKDLQMFRR